MSSRRTKEEARAGLHPLVAGTALALAVAGVLAAGAWGLAAPRGHDDHDAAAGHAAHAAGTAQAITIPGGLVTVDRVGDVDLSMPMQGPGMSMPPDSGTPNVPKGYRLIDVDVTLRALDSSLRFEANRFRVQGQGVGPTAPLPSVEDAGSFVPQRGSLSRTLTFQIPDAARDLVLTVEGGDRPLELTVGPAPPGSHGGHS